MKKFLTFWFIVVCFCVSVYSQEPKPTITPEIRSGQTDLGNGRVMGTGIGQDSRGAVNSFPSNAKIEPFRILAKPRANYTDEARKNGDEGVIRLRVTFLGSGEVGAVFPINNLPNGLTEQAIAAAKQIKFIPQKRDGQPVAATKVLEYAFSIYYKENDEDLKNNAEILEMPTPENPAGENLKGYSGKVHIILALVKTGQIQIIQLDSDLPQEFKQKAVEAVAKIKFKPAVHKNGKEVSQTKDIEYEFKAHN